MRFHFTDTRRHRRLTKDLAAALRKAGRDVGHTEAADIAARLYGYADRHELDACAGAARVPASRWDEDEAPSVVEARRRRHAEVLQGAGLTPEAADAALRELRPTARGRRSPAKPDAGTGRVPPGTASPMPGGSMIGSLLDEWETDRGVTAAPDVRGARLFAYLVGVAYDTGYDTLVFHVARPTGTLKITAENRTDSKVLHGGPEEEGRSLLEWLTACKDEAVVTHAGVDIPVALSSMRTSAGNIIQATLGLSLVPPGPTLADCGIGGIADWPSVLASRPGFHVLCADYGFSRFLEAVGHAMEPYGIPVLPTSSAAMVQANLLPQAKEPAPIHPDRFEGMPATPSMLVPVDWTFRLSGTLG